MGSTLRKEERRTLRRLRLPETISAKALWVVLTAQKCTAKHAIGLPQKLRLRVCLVAALALLSQGAKERVHGYWFPVDLDDPGANWCRPCAEKRLIELRREDSDKVRRWLNYDGDDFALVSDEELSQRTNCIDGGWVSEVDSPAECEGCGVPLDHILSDDGVTQEIEHFLRYTPDINNPEEWYELDEANKSRWDAERWADIETIVMHSLRASAGRRSRLCRNSALKNKRKKLEAILTNYPGMLMGLSKPGAWGHYLRAMVAGVLKRKAGQCPKRRSKEAWAAKTVLRRAHRLHTAQSPKWASFAARMRVFNADYGRFLDAEI